MKIKILIIFCLLFNIKLKAQDTLAYSTRLDYTDEFGSEVFPDATNIILKEAFYLKIPVYKDKNLNNLYNKNELNEVLNNENNFESIFNKYPDFFQFINICDTFILINSSPEINFYFDLKDIKKAKNKTIQGFFYDFCYTTLYKEFNISKLDNYLKYENIILMIYNEFMNDISNEIVYEGTYNNKIKCEKKYEKFSTKNIKDSFLLKYNPKDTVSIIRGFRAMSFLFETVESFDKDEYLNFKIDKIGFSFFNNLQMRSSYFDFPQKYFMIDIKTYKKKQLKRFWPFMDLFIKSNIKMKLLANTMD